MCRLFHNVITMKFWGVFVVCVACLLGGSLADAFVSAPAAKLSASSLPMKNNFDAEGYAKSMSAAAIDQMRNLKPDDLDKMISEIDSMGGVQKAALKAMNMDVSSVFVVQLLIFVSILHPNGLTALKFAVPLLRFFPA
jgi:hypothetical protein